MAAQALYLKYRPQTFEEIVGQDPITRTLRNALGQGKVRHAYLFTGPRGTGKTSMARLMAKAVNCHAPEDERPCNTCPICVAINEARLLDLIEIDAASNRGIDEIRDIREKVGFRPNEGRYKVYVLDEAHMLTEPAFNALLKTLEEPPPHVIFTLVTTDPHKIPATITSRCQRFDFRRIPLETAIERLAYIAREEGVTVEPAALEFIAHQGTGAMRDSISLLDQLTSYGDEISLEQVQMVLGSIASEAAGDLVTFLSSGNIAEGLDLINRTVGDGADPRQFGREVVEYLRGLLLVQQGAGSRLLNATTEQAAKMESLASEMSTEQLLWSIRLFNKAATDIKSGLQSIPQLPLEMALVESTLESPAAANRAAPGPQKNASFPAPVQSAPVRPRTAAQPPAVAPSTEAAAPVVETKPEAAPPVADPVETGPPEPRAEAAPPVQGPPKVTHNQIAEEPATMAPPSAGAPTAGARPPAVAGPLTLQSVKGLWVDVLLAVRKRNPATQAVLNTGCEPVDVIGDEIIVTFPFPFLGDKLGSPKRKAEIQDSLAEVLGTNCRLRLVLAGDYTPQAQGALTGTAGAEPFAAAPTAPAAASADAEADVPERISKWAEERGGKAKVVPPQDNRDP